MLIQVVMHLPELVLRSSGFGRFSRNLGVGMDLRERKIAEDEAKVFAESLLNLLNNRVGWTAEGTLVIAVFHERHGRVCGPLNVVAARIYFQSAKTVRRLSFCHAAAPLLSSSSNASRIPSAPGLTVIGET